MDATAPVFLETDACDHGIGAYLYQVVDDEQRPVAFISKSLSGSQLNWSTYEKEAYAIYYSFIKLEHLIRDIKFTLKTDHQALVCLEQGKGRVLRWKLEIQEFNFNIFHLPGTENVVADAFSRLCSLREDIIDDDTFRIPQDIYKKISKVHNSTVGHFGIELTYNRLILILNHQPYLKEYVKRFIKRCPCCQKMSQIKYPIQTSPFVTSTYQPMQQLNIDVIGPLPISTKGYCHIMVIIDTFTRFVELYPLPDTSAIEAANAILNHCGRYGIPTEIVSDRGPQFVNDIFNSLIKILNTEHVFTIAYSKQENSIVERSNKEVMRHFRAIIFDNQLVNDWIIYLPMVQRIINSKIHDSIGVSPANLLFGNSINLDNQLLKNVNISEPQQLSVWVSDMLNKQNQFLKIAEKHQRIKNMKHLNKEIDELTVFPINSYVLLSYPTRPPNKLATQLAGPFRVVSSVGANYEILDLISNKIKNVHISRLKPFYFEKQNNPRLIANKDKLVWDVEKIIRHEGLTTKKTSMKFVVKWAGFPDSDNTIESWSTLSTNKRLHEYLKDNNLTRLIPKSYQKINEIEKN
jgi:hypothetical protein